MYGVEREHYPTPASVWREREERVQRVVARNRVKTRVSRFGVLLPEYTTNSVELVKLTPSKIEELLAVFGNHSRIFADADRNKVNYLQILTMPDSIFWEIPKKALFYLTDVRASNMAYAHIIIYHWEALRCRELLVNMIKEIFKNLQLRRLNVLVPSDNRRVVLLIRTLGFKREGCLRDWEYRDGRWASMLHFGILRKE